MQDRQEQGNLQNEEGYFTQILYHLQTVKTLKLVSLSRYPTVSQKQMKIHVYVK